MFIEAAKCKNKNKKNVYFLFNAGLCFGFFGFGDDGWTSASSENTVGKIF